MWIYREFSVKKARSFVTRSRPVFGAVASRCDSFFAAGRRTRAMPESTRPSLKRSFAEIAQAEGVTDRYVAHLIPLAFLAPDIVARVLSGTQPVDLTTEALTKRIDLPLAWTEQRALMGFE